MASAVSVSSTWGRPSTVQHVDRGVRQGGREKADGNQPVFEGRHEEGLQQFLIIGKAQRRSPPCIHENTRHIPLRDTTDTPKRLHLPRALACGVPIRNGLERLTDDVRVLHASSRDGIYPEGRRPATHGLPVPRVTHGPMSGNFDIIVVGAGHAGCEAALAAARLGRQVAMVTLRRDHVGRLSCNPAVGGLAKGHLVREIDALGGAMARVADASTIQFRRLNTRKGLAVQASRAQVDIDRYPGAMAALLASTPGLTLIEGEVAGLCLRDSRVAGIRLGDGSEIRATAVILTTGTFLGGVMHRGRQQEAGGRVGDPATGALSTDLRELGLRLGRLKTGTTPRLDARTIDWDRVQVQRDTVPDGHFSFSPPTSRLPRMDCHVAYTTPETHDLVRSGLTAPRCSRER